MPRVTITAETGVRDWELALAAMELRLWRSTFAASKMAMYLIERNVKVYLRTFTHPPGTKTPSPRGGPPAMITGNLIRSWRTTPAREGRKLWTVEAFGGPTAVYSRIQELSGQAGRGLMTHIPKRPYVRPMLRASRRGVRRIYIEYWTAAIHG